MRTILLALGGCSAFAGNDAEFFESKVRPVLAANCHGCHTKTQMGGLRLDSRDAALKGGKSGPALVPGKPDDSLMIQAVRRTHARLKMPPTAALSESDTAALAEWVKQGAIWPDSPLAATDTRRDFWSFQPVRKPAAPKLKNTAWAKTEIDRHILAKLEASGLKPVTRADKATLLRRATLDLTGLPPTPEEMEAFQADNTDGAFATVVDRLLASPRYGERWARHWLDLARYSDGQLAAGVDTPFPNAYRYRDWVVEALNKDMPYDRFVKAQIAADLMPESERAPLIAGLGFQSLGSGANDQVDVTTKVFLGLTVGCAQCHDHNYDPIPTRDYYSLLGVFRGSQTEQYPLVAKADVESYEKQKKRIDELKEVLADYIDLQQKQLVDTLARHTADYMVAAWKKDYSNPRLDRETLDRWVKYLASPEREHPFMKPWFEAMAKNPDEAGVRKAAEEFEQFTLQLLDDSKEVDDKNYVAFGGKKGMKDERTRQYTNIVSLPVLKFYQWRELASGPYNIDGFRAPAGVYYYSAKELDRWLGGFQKTHIEQLRAEIKALDKELPPMYPFLHSMKDAVKPGDLKVALRGDPKTPGEIAPRRFLTALCDGEPKAFKIGSGRLELADAIASKDNPLTARVMVNRLWQHHFGHGIVRSPSNFGQMGERPTHPELLDYLAARLVESGWSLKAIHREIMLSNTYALKAAADERNAEKDPDNRLLWRANVRQRLDMEALRDSVLAVSGKLDPAVGGAPAPLSEKNQRRSLYLTVSRTRLDPEMALFDFPDPNASAEERPVTTGPLQGLFFLNSKFVAEHAGELEKRISKEAGTANPARVERAYRLLFGRKPDGEELKLGLDYVASGGTAWRQYLQALLGSGEFTSVN